MPHVVLPVSSRPSGNTEKNWAGVKWDKIRLPKPDDEEDDEDNDNDVTDSGAEYETPGTVQLGDERIPLDAAMQRLYQGRRRDAEPTQSTESTDYRLQLLYFPSRFLKEHLYIGSQLH